MNRAQRRQYTRLGSGLLVPDEYRDKDEMVEYTRVVFDRQDYGALLSDRGQRGVEHLMRELEDMLSTDIPAPVVADAREANSKLVAVDREGDQIGFMQVVG